MGVARDSDDDREDALWFRFASSKDNPDGSAELGPCNGRPRGVAAPSVVDEAVKSVALSVAATEDAAIDSWSSASATAEGKMNESDVYDDNGDRSERLDSCIVLSRMVCWACGAAIFLGRSCLVGEDIKLTGWSSLV